MSTDKPTLYCSFCGKSNHEVKKMIAGPSAFICDECTELCGDIIRPENPEPSVLLTCVPVALRGRLEMIEIPSPQDFLVSGGLSIEQQSGVVNGREMIEAVLGALVTALTACDMTEARTVAIQQIEIQMDERYRQHKSDEERALWEIEELRRRLTALKRGAPLDGAEAEEIPTAGEPKEPQGLTTTTVTRSTE